MTATVSREAGDDGVLFTTGTQNSGYSFFVKEDRLCFDYNAFGEHTLVESDTVIAPGASELTVRFERDGQSGAAELRIGGEPTGRVDIPWVMNDVLDRSGHSPWPTTLRSARVLRPRSPSRARCTNSSSRSTAHALGA